MVEAYNPDYTRVSGKMFLTKLSSEIDGCGYAIHNDRTKSLKCNREEMMDIISTLKNNYPNNDIFHNLIIIKNGK